MTKTPYEQGALDGLCGVYSIVNAARIVQRLDDEAGKDLFRQIIIYLSQRRMLGRILVEGLNLHVIGGIFRNVNELGSLQRNMPFKRDPETPLDRFWTDMLAFLGDCAGRAVLLGLGGVYDHWTVVESITDRRIRLFDSYGLKTLNRHRCTTLRPTSRRPHKLCPTHTYFLS
jgi:hypothetical protein